MARLHAHLFSSRWHLRRLFPPRTLDAIQACIREEEGRHRGEIRFAVESCLEFRRLLAGLTPAARAREVFGQLGVWDTEENTGVLIYVLLADRHLEIVADRGFRGRVAPEEWTAVCAAVQAEFAAGRYEAGALLAIRRVSALVARAYPHRPGDINELPDAPVVLR
jgi:uncharacterized membrane protein